MDRVVSWGNFLKRRTLGHNRTVFSGDGCRNPAIAIDAISYGKVWTAIANVLLLKSPREPADIAFPFLRACLVHAVISIPLVQKIRQVSHGLSRVQGKDMLIYLLNLNRSKDPLAKFESVNRNLSTISRVPASDGTSFDIGSRIQQGIRC
jgi:hypothetical protein